MRRLLSEAGLAVVSVERVVHQPSTWKLQRLPLYRKWLRLGYYGLRKQMPELFGMLFVTARRSAQARTVPAG